jgi:hypothetical protein
MDLLERLILQHKFKPSYVRTNLVTSPDELKVYANSKFLRKPIFSNCIRSGPMLECVQRMLPGINELCLNKCDPTRPMPPHRDGKNSSELSWIALFGEFTGGALCLEDGRRFEDRGVWHAFDGKNILHWVEPFEGERYSVVAYARKHPARAPRRPCKACNPEQLDPSDVQSLER